MRKSNRTVRKKSAEQTPVRVRLPGFVGEEAIGLGDVISHMTDTVGIKRCGGCAQRMIWLNQRVIFVGANRKSN